jgi:RNA polymerase sigma-70 factor, ECF subfamily
LKPDEPQGRSKGVMDPEPRDAREARIRSLLERSRGGDQAAFRELVVLHQDQAYGLALRITRSPADAEEVAQDAFLRAWLALARFRGESSFGTWLYRIVARRALDRVERIQSRRGREVGGEEAVSLAEMTAAPVGAEEHEAAARARRLERMVSALPAAQRAAVTLYYYEDRSVEQVAEILGMPENTVKTHLSRARAALRVAWQREEP